MSAKNTKTIRIDFGGSKDKCCTSQSQPTNWVWEKRTKPERHMSLLMELNDIYTRKNNDYGDSFHQTFLEEGFAMARVRLSDKLDRFKKLSRNASECGLVKDESIRDTLMDLANYAIMTVLEIDDKKAGIE